jgi:hypothetical protein
MNAVGDGWGWDLGIFRRIVDGYWVRLCQRSFFVERVHLASTGTWWEGHTPYVKAAEMLTHVMHSELEEIWTSAATPRAIIHFHGTDVGHSKPYSTSILDLHELPNWSPATDWMPPKRTLSKGYETLKPHRWCIFLGKKISRIFSTATQPRKYTFYICFVLCGCLLIVSIWHSVEFLRLRIPGENTPYGSLTPVQAWGLVAWNRIHYRWVFSKGETNIGRCLDEIEGLVLLPGQLLFILNLDTWEIFEVV